MGAASLPRLSSSRSLCSRCSSKASDSSSFRVCSAISWLNDCWMLSSSPGLLWGGGTVELGLAIAAQRRQQAQGPLRDLGDREGLNGTQE